LTPDVFAALSDPTRRAIYERLGAEGACTATHIARDSAVTRQAIAKHLAVLEEAGLVTRRRDGNRVEYHVTGRGLDEVEAWVGKVRSRWEHRLDRIDSV
jgi:DNA-binding transcriptional ArsR family regulator